MKVRVKPFRKSRKISKSSFLYFISLSILAITFLSCEGDEQSIVAAFNHSLIDENLVEFTNESTGDYYSSTWDFGNGRTETVTKKNESFEIYYPNAGNYRVSLKIIDYVGNSDTISKSIVIENSDLSVSFTYEIDSEKPNYVNLINTTQGSYDSFKWKYRNLEVENEDSFIAYFPRAGSYEIELEVEKNNNRFSTTQSVFISQDDPEYIEGMTLVWSDEFNDGAIDGNNWSLETGASGWGNSELQNYTSSGNAAIVEGKLVITARKVNDNTSVGSYTSARMVTKGKQEFRYGRIEIRAKLPAGRGVWPAIWMLGTNFSTAGWPECGEIDIMEYVGYEPNVVHSTIHTPSGFGGNGSGSSKILSSCEEEFHIYGLLWDEEEIVFYTDSPENITHTYSPLSKNLENWPFNQPAFFIFNIAIGGSWGGLQGIDNSIFPQQMEIDYVRVYQESTN